MSKYNNRKTRCLSKHLHDSKFEADYCNRLLAMKQKGEVAHYFIQQSFKIGAGIKHVVDFLVWRLEKGYIIQEVHETKGVWTAVARMKMKLFKEKYPYIPYIVIYQRQNKRRNKWPKKIRMVSKLLR